MSRSERRGREGKERERERQVGKEESAESGRAYLWCAVEIFLFLGTMGTFFNVFKRSLRNSWEAWV
eukprot:757946-Amorphochlora_amoeboformis.AAC.1